jgi:hypothetical protein
MPGWSTKEENLRLTGLPSTGFRTLIIASSVTRPARMLNTFSSVVQSSVSSGAQFLVGPVWLRLLPLLHSCFALGGLRRMTGFRETNPLGMLYHLDYNMDSGMEQCLTMCTDQSNKSTSRSKLQN